MTPGQSRSGNGDREGAERVSEDGRAAQAERERAMASRSSRRLEELLRDDEGAPPLTAAQAALHVGVTPHALNRHARAGRYVCAPLRRRNRYPRWQFGPDGSVPSAELSMLWAHFGARRRWQWIAYLCTPQPDLGGDTPMHWLIAGGEFAVVDRLARKQLGLIESL